MPVTIYPTNLKYKNSNGQFQSATAIKGDSGAAITVQVEGSTPTIVCEDNHRYICGEVLSLNITLPDSGIVDIVFESGSTPTVLTITPPSGVTVKWAGGFDQANLEANATYYLKFIDGEYGVATAWGVSSGGGSNSQFELIKCVELAEDSQSVIIDSDSANNPFTLNGFLIFIYSKAASDATSEGYLKIALNSTNHGTNRIADIYAGIRRTGDSSIVVNGQYVSIGHFGQITKHDSAKVINADGEPTRNCYTTSSIGTFFAMQQNVSSIFIGTDASTLKLGAGSMVALYGHRV